MWSKALTSAWGHRCCYSIPRLGTGPLTSASAGQLGAQGRATSKHWGSLFHLGRGAGAAPHSVLGRGAGVGGGGPAGHAACCLPGFICGCLQSFPFNKMERPVNNKPAALSPRRPPHPPALAVSLPTPLPVPEESRQTLPAAVQDGSATVKCAGLQRAQGQPFSTVFAFLPRIALIGINPNALRGTNPKGALQS